MNRAGRRTLWNPSVLRNFLRAETVLPVYSRMPGEVARLAMTNTYRFTLNPEKQAWDAYHVEENMKVEFSSAELRNWFAAHIGKETTAKVTIIIESETL